MEWKHILNGEAGMPTGIRMNLHPAGSDFLGVYTDYKEGRFSAIFFSEDGKIHEFCPIMNIEVSNVAVAGNDFAVSSAGKGWAQGKLNGTSSLCASLLTPDTFHVTRHFLGQNVSPNTHSMVFGQAIVAQSHSAEPCFFVVATCSDTDSQKLIKFNRNTILWSLDLDANISVDSILTHGTTILLTYSGQSGDYTLAKYTTDGAFITNIQCTSNKQCDVVKSAHSQLVMHNKFITLVTRATPGLDWNFYVLVVDLDSKKNELIKLPLEANDYVRSIRPIAHDEYIVTTFNEIVILSHDFKRIASIKNNSIGYDIEDAFDTTSSDIVVSGSSSGMPPQAFIGKIKRDQFIRESIADQ